MATVFLAHDLKHDRPVALKVLLPELGAALGPERFEREIKLAARLQHPHILSVHDSGEAAGQLWFTMPYVAGESLRHRLSRERQLPVEEAVRLTREVAEALDYAHRQGVIHRDIKPENILLAEGHALVADFGIARAVGTGDQPLTGTGVAIGTPAYMSPEQASGTREVDARTDVYALGCVLFEMLAGEPPYTGPTPQAVMARALTETPRPIHPMRLAVPEALDAVIAKATAATAADRYTSAADFAHALELATGQKGARQPRSASGVFADRPILVALILGVLLGTGALFAWRRSHGGDEASSARLVAVLPFENLGAPDVEYVVDGISDEVRERLFDVPGVEVIARGSSTPYKRTTKPPQVIAQELNVRYLLTATVRWETSGGSVRRARVSTELVEVRSDGAPRTKWQQAFDVTLDASLTDVFQVYANIAGRVAGALGVALGDSTRQQMADRSTKDSAAYLAYLKGEEVSQSLNANGDMRPLRQAAAYYAQATSLDSTFVQAWAQLSRAHSILYFNSTPTPAEADKARTAAERAMALAPNRAEGHVAMGDYLYAVVKDNAGAVSEFERGLGFAPNDATVLTNLAQAELALGRWESAKGHLQRARILDPRTVFASGGGLTWVLVCLRQYPEAQEAADHALAVAPSRIDVVEDRTIVALAQGDLGKARDVIAKVPKEVDPKAVAADLANVFDLYWVLDDAQQVSVLNLTPDAWDGDRGTWGLILAQIFALRGDSARMRAYADSSLGAIEEQLRAVPSDAERHAFHGLALAYLGQKAKAIQEGQRAVALMPISKDALVGPYLQHQLVRIFILVGEPEKALDQLEPLLRIPYYLSPGWLKIDPNFDPLRGNPRFQKLVQGGS
jgi:eukaryotic-like serine/threonine-protein kinase